MNKKMRELQAKILEKTNAAKSFTEGDNKDLAKAQAILDEVAELQKELEIEAKLLELSKGTVETAKPVEPAKVDSIKAFADAARMGFKSMNEGVGADGGYTVPEDISTQINTLKEDKFRLATLIDHEVVSTKSGKRTYKTRAQATGFQAVGEGGKITKSGKPQFSIIEYAIKKYAGYLPVTNELLEDSDAAIANTIMNWLADESVATENAQIIAAINTKSATAMTGLADIKKAVNVTLSAFKGSISIVTNDDGLNYLDSLVDGLGRPYLTADPAVPMQMRLAVGARYIPIVQVPNAVLATNGTKLPFVIGDLKEYLKHFDRNQLSVMQSNVASVEGFNAYEQDMTLFRGIMRADFVVKDSAAIVRGELTPAE